MTSRYAPSGRFIYAAYKHLDTLYARLEDMYADGELLPCEVKIETVRDHRHRVLFYAITIA